MKTIQKLLKNSLWLILAGLVLSSTNLYAKGENIDTMALRIALDNLMPGSMPDSITETALPGIYEVSYGTAIFYFNKDASMMLKGDLIDMKNKVNITEEKRTGARVTLIEAQGEENMIIYPAKDEKYKVTVFTDIDCPYCVKLHREMPEYNKRGITVRYMAYPRAGIGSPSYDKIVSVWCSKDKKQAMSDAKYGNGIAAKTCTNPVASQFALGQEIGVRGTPALFLSDGTMLPGYVQSARLKALLDENKK
ncbi:MAG: DsbC family protein [Pseudomonadota bacterium]